MSFTSSGITACSSTLISIMTVSLISSLSIVVLSCVISIRSSNNEMRPLGSFMSSFLSVLLSVIPCSLSLIEQ